MERNTLMPILAFIAKVGGVSYVDRSKRKFITVPDLFSVSFTVLMEMSNLLNTGLDSESLSICVKLIEAGVNPEALALVIKELRRESAAIQVNEYIFFCKKLVYKKQVLRWPKF